MTINLRDFERGKKYEGDYSADLAALQERLARIQVAHIVHRRRSIILIEDERIYRLSALHGCSCFSTPTPPTPQPPNPPTPQSFGSHPSS